MDTDWFTARCRAAANERAHARDFAAARALRALADEIDTEVARLDTAELERLHTTGSTAPNQANGDRA